MIDKVAFTVYPVTDADRARAFYEAVLGLRLGQHGEHEGKFWIEYDMPGGGCLAISNATAGQPGGTGGGTIALEVSDLDAMLVRLNEAGVTVEGSVIHGPRCRMIPCRDPDGNALLLHQRNRAT